MNDLLKKHNTLINLSTMVKKFLIWKNLEYGSPDIMIYDWVQEHVKELEEELKGRRIYVKNYHSYDMKTYEISTRTEYILESIYISLNPVSPGLQLMSKNSNNTNVDLYRFGTTSIIFKDNYSTAQ